MIKRYIEEDESIKFWVICQHLEIFRYTQLEEKILSLIPKIFFEILIRNIVFKL